MTKEFYVGVCRPWPGKTMMWDAAENKDGLCADLLHSSKGIRLPLLKLEAKNEVEAVKEYQSQVPAVKDWKLVNGWEDA